MIKKIDLINLEKQKEERDSLIKRIKKLESKPRKVIIDGVKGSSTEFPYTQHTCRIEGLEDGIVYRNRKKLLKKLRKILRFKEYKIEKEIIHIEYELNYVEDSEIREIIRLKYEEGFNWIQIMHRCNYNNPDTPRKILERFFQKKTWQYA